jgi:hypothetical protein
MRVVPLLVAGFLIAAGSPRGAHSQAADTIRGKITTDSAAPIAGAQVIVTRAPDRAYLSTLTNQAGEYQIVFDSGTGDYLVHVAVANYVTARRRVTRAANERVLIADFKMKSSVQTLETVSVTASRQKPSRGTESATGTEIGESAHISGGVAGRLSPDQEGDLTAINQALPGVATTPAGASVLGVGPGQNSTTLGGMAFAGSDVPRDARVIVKSSTSTYDPSRGWFSGLQTNVDLGIGGPFAARPSHLTLDAPQLQVQDPIGSQTGQRFTRLQLSTGGDGLMDEEKFAYNYGIQGGRRTSDAVSLLDARPDVLQRVGISADSVARLRTILSNYGVLGTDPGPRERFSDNVSLIGRIDHKPFNYTTFQEPKQTWGAIAYAKFSRNTAVGVQPTSIGSHAGDNSESIASIQAIYSTHVAEYYLAEFRSSLSGHWNQGEPYLHVPEGRVIVSSAFPDNTTALAVPFFGGSQSFGSRHFAWTWETTNQTTFYLAGHAKHRLALSADTRLDGFNQNGGASSLGNFTFNSLADLAANRPASFTRRLYSPATNIAEWNGYGSIADYFTVKPTFRLLYGARIEGNHFLDRPESNPDIATLFQNRTDAVPNTVHISPRFGFNWARQRGGERHTVSRLGDFWFLPVGWVRGGIGEFRNFLGPDLLSNSVNSTGLSNGARDLACYGAAAPIADWAGYLSGTSPIPARCNQSASAVFSDTARNVRFFDNHYTAPHSWRANLSYSSVVKSVTYNIEGVYSLNLNQPGATDLNMSNAPRFFSADEQRPVFVSAASIVPSTGVVSPVEARLQSGYGHVFKNGSDLRSDSRMLTVTATPILARNYLSLSYSLGSSRADARGFDGSTFGSPWIRERSRSDFDARHQFQLQAGTYLKTVALTVSARVQSGLPFTPLIGSDVNGDGLANDRAFLFNAGSPNSTAPALQSFLASAPDRIRRCLTSQMGGPAGRNSCDGPWTATVNARIGFTKRLPHSEKSANVGIFLINPLAGLDQLLHGSNIHGWGSSALPDPMLYSVRGFDPTTNRFVYDVNQRFGSTSPATSVFRTPFRITIDVSVNLGSSLGEQQIARWLQPGRAGHPGKKLTPAELKTRYARGVPNPYELILELSDSLLLDKGQVHALQAADTAYLQRIDSVWDTLATYLASLGDDFDSREALKRQEAATDEAWEVARLDVQSRLPKILNPLQLQLLPWPSGLLYQSKKPVHIRIFMAG